MRIAIAKEYLSWERRVAVAPADAARLSEAGYEVFVQAGAGELAAFTDREYRMAGATVVEHVAAESIDILTHVRPIHPAVLPRMRRGSYTVGVLRTEDHPDINAAMRATGVRGVALEHLGAHDAWDVVDPVTAGDVLFGRGVATTCAATFDGTVNSFVVPGCVLPAARVLILGASVSGLAAANTLRASGAHLTVVDTDPGAATHAHAVDAEFVEAAGRQQQRRDRLAAYVADADVVIVTATAAGRLAFEIDEALMVRMKAGAVLANAAEPWSASREPEQFALPSGGHVTVLHPVYGTTLATAGSKLFSATLTNFVLDHTSDAKFTLDETNEPSIRALLRPTTQITLDGPADNHQRSGSATSPTPSAQPSEVTTA